MAWLHKVGVEVCVGARGTWPKGFPFWQCEVHSDRQRDSVASQPAEDQQPSAAPETITVEITSAEPSWIALRRGGTVEFQGTLDEPLTIDNPENVEIYAGRPDLVMINVSDQEPSRLSTIDDVRWHELIPER